MEIDFITLRRRSPTLLREVYGCRARLGAPSNWTCPPANTAPRASMSRPVDLAGARFRQIFVLDLGHDKPTILLTNQRHAPAHGTDHPLCPPHAHRERLSDAVRFFHMDALSSAVGLKVDFDMALLVIASGLYRLLARRMRGYADAQARQIFRDLIDMPGRPSR